MAKKDKKEYVQNKFHIKVRRWCGSCAHKIVDKDGRRVCAAMQLLVTRTMQCRKWEMDEAFVKAGKAEGVIKDKDTKDIIIR